LLDVAQAWAAAVYAGGAGARGAGEPAPVLPAADLASAVRDAFERGAGPVFVASADAARLTPEHARMALADLAAGADACFGPGMDGGWYLVALAAPHDALLDLLDAPRAGLDVMSRTFGLAATTGLELGILRQERLLRSLRDATALRLDPRTPAPVRCALAHLG